MLQMVQPSLSRPWKPRAGLRLPSLSGLLASFVQHKVDVDVADIGLPEMVWSLHSSL